MMPLRGRNDPMAGNTVVKPARPEDAIAANFAGATDGLVYRVDMCMGAGRPYTEVVMTVGFPGPFMLITHNPKARLPPSAHGVRHVRCCPQQCAPSCVGSALGSNWLNARHDLTF